MPPGLERAALYELHRFYHDVFQGSLEEYRQFPGGLEVQLPLNKGLQLNYLKIPTRCLLRLGTRPIVEESDYKSFIQEQPWEIFGAYRKLYISSRTSELQFKDDLERIFKKTVKIKSSNKGSDIYIRFFRDECTLSVDTSGEDLYVRGYDKWVGEAPLRDNIAAGLLQFSVQGIHNFEDWVLMDPVAGSGTFLLEASQMSKPYSRKFGFHQWKLEGIDKVSIPQHLPSLAQDFHHFHAFDQDEKVLSLAEKNLKQLKVRNYSCEKRDAFLTKKKFVADKKKMVMINPPYGKRLKIKDWNFFTDLLNAVAQWTEADRIGIMVPRGNFLEHPDYEMVRSLDMLNNGIEIFFYLFIRRN